MSKSKCEIDLERMNSRAQPLARKGADEKDETIAALQRQIERQQMAAGWFNTTQIMQDIDRIQYERDQAKADVQRLVDTFARAYQVTVERMQKSDKDADSQVRLLNEVSETYGEPEVCGVLNLIYNIHEKTFISIEES